MSLTNTASADRLHIAFFGLRNAGKSSLVNAVTGQELSVVSDVRGTTTDPVKKAMELLPLGPVVIIDTPGLDDEGALGDLRIKKARGILSQTDIAVLVIDAKVGMTEPDEDLTRVFQEKKIPYIVAFNKSDLLESRNELSENALYVSAITGENIDSLKDRLGALAKSRTNDKKIVADLLHPGDTVVLVIPIDEAAPKGRLILPQQQTLRELLDAHCTVICCQDTDLRGTLAGLSQKPKMVITDSQAFGRVSMDTPEDVLLTSFSILFARYKGNLETLVRGAARLSELKDGDRILISEGCTHHRQCNDIGSVKMPGWIRNFTGAELAYSFSSGGDFPDDPKGYALVVHCGGCMLNEAEMKSRVSRAISADVPIVNYGVAIAHMHGILRRSLEPFPEVLRLLG